MVACFALFVIIPSVEVTVRIVKTRLGSDLFLVFLCIRRAATLITIQYGQENWS